MDWMGPATRYLRGRKEMTPSDDMPAVSPLGGTPRKGPNPLVKEVPDAPGVASRTKPGTVPPRLRGRR